MQKQLHQQLDSTIAIFRSSSLNTPPSHLAQRLAQSQFQQTVPSPAVLHKQGFPKEQLLALPSGALFSSWFSSLEATAFSAIAGSGIETHRELQPRILGLQSILLCRLNHPTVHIVQIRSRRIFDHITKFMEIPSQPNYLPTIHIIKSIPKA